MLRVTGDSVSNREILQRTGLSRQLRVNIAQLRFLRHVLRREKLKDLALNERPRGPVREDDNGSLARRRH